MRNVRGSYPIPEGEVSRLPVTVSDAISDLPSLRQGGGADETFYPTESRLTAYQKLMRGLTPLDAFLGSFSKEG